MLDAALAIVLEDGLAALTTTAVTARAGVSRGAYLHHFPTRETLVTALVEVALDRQERALAAVLADGHDDPEAIVAALWRITDGPGFGVWLELVAAGRTTGELRATVAALSERFAALGRAAWPDAGPAAIMLMFATMNGLMLDRVLGINADLVDEAVALLPQVLRSASASDRAGSSGPEHAGPGVRTTPGASSE